jgi:hypothetical protein
MAALAGPGWRPGARAGDGAGAHPPRLAAAGTTSLQRVLGAQHDIVASGHFGLWLRTVAPCLHRADPAYQSPVSFGSDSPITTATEDGGFAFIAGRACDLTARHQDQRRSHQGCPGGSPSVTPQPQLAPASAMTWHAQPADERGTPPAATVDLASAADGIVNPPDDAAPFSRRSALRPRSATRQALTASGLTVWDSYDVRFPLSCRGISRRLFSQ